jgi:hypothetical protein
MFGTMERMGIDQHLAEIERDLTHQLEQVQNARAAMRRLVDGDRHMVPVETMERELRRLRNEFTGPQQGDLLDPGYRQLGDSLLGPQNDITEAGLKAAAEKLRETPTPSYLAGESDAKPWPGSGEATVSLTTKSSRGNRLSPAARARIKAANKARWAAYRAAKAAKVKPATKRTARRKATRRR